MSNVSRDFDRVHKFIRSICIKFVNKTPVEFDEVFQEACLAFVKAYPKYSADRGALTTFTYSIVMNRLRKLYWKNRKITVNIEESLELYCSVMDIPVNEISSDARKAIEVASACEGGKIRPASIRKLTRDYLRSEGWQANRIEAAFSEIRQEVLI